MCPHPAKRFLVESFPHTFVLETSSCTEKRENSSTDSARATDGVAGDIWLYLCYPFSPEISLVTFCCGHFQTRKSRDKCGSGFLPFALLDAVS